MQKDILALMNMLFSGLAGQSQDQEVIRLPEQSHGEQGQRQAERHHEGPEHQQPPQGQGHQQGPL